MPISIIMKSKIKKYAKEFIYFIITLTILMNIVSLYKSQSLNDTPLNINAVKLINNQIYKLPTNKPVLIHFWATWCPTCKLEASNIEFLSKYYNIITIAVNSGNNTKIQNFIKQHHYTFKVVNDNNGQIASKFKISAFPTTFIYNKNKKLIFSEVGYTSTFGMWIRILWTKF